jgi:hypothetical protein
VKCLAVKVGIPGSERQLGLMLDGYGTVQIATDFLNSGSTELAYAAEWWASAHGYTVYHSVGSATARWGRF